MSDNSTAQAVPHSVPQGTPVTIATTVQPQPVAVANPLMDLTVWAPFLAIITAMFLLGGLFSKHITGKIADFRDVHKPVHDAIDKSFHRITNDITTDRARIHTLESFRNADVERIVRLETNLHAIEKGQERIENTLDKMEREGKEGRAEIIESIRELREVKHRP